MKSNTHKTDISVHVEQRITGWKIIMREGNFRVSMEATKENWRYIEHKLTKSGETFVRPAQYDEWPENGEETYSEIIPQNP